VFIANQSQLLIQIQNELPVIAITRSTPINCFYTLEYITFSDINQHCCYFSAAVLPEIRENVDSRLRGNDRGSRNDKGSRDDKGRGRCGVVRERDAECGVPYGVGSGALV